ncbi:MAG: hypothetical protein WBB67_11110 [bacterium]
MSKVIRTSKHLIYLTILILLFIDCDAVTVNEYETQFNVYLVMYNYLPYTEVFVDRAYAIDEPSEPYVEDALVTLSTSNTVDTLFFDEMYGRYVKWYMDLQPGTTYYLQVSKQGLDTLFGETTVPGEFEFLNQPYDTITLEDTIIFHRSNGAIVYYCLFLSDGRQDKFWLKPDTLDSLVKIRVGDYIGNLPEGLCDILITAFDHNYYEYTFEPDDSLMQAGVRGGLGLCGSAWREGITLYLDTEQ